MSTLLGRVLEVKIGVDRTISTFVKFPMSQPEALNEKQLAELGEIFEIAKDTEQKAREMSEMATKIAEKWRQLRLKREATLEKPANSIG